MTDTNLLHNIEECLSSSRPFGDIEYLDACTAELYSARLDILSEHLSEARSLYNSLLGIDVATYINILRDPIVRNSINKALVYFKINKEPMSDSSVQEWAAILKSAETFLVPELNGNSPLEAGLAHRVRLPGQQTDSLIWCGARDESLAASRFASLFCSTFPGMQLIEPETRELEILVTGANLLHEMLPLLGRSALHHVHLVAIAGSKDRTQSFTSVTHPGIPGTIFFSRSILENEWRVAEYLLHEGLHAKFLDIKHTHSMLRHLNPGETPKEVRPHWNRPRPNRQNVWGVDRCLTVLHVYVSLGLFFLRLQQLHGDFALRFGQRYAPDNPSLSARRSFDRARYLASELSDSKELGAAGEAFVIWLTDMLEKLDPDPLFRRGSAHLFLDRYFRECYEIESAVENAVASNDLELPLYVTHMLREEAIAAKHGLTALGSPNSAARVSDVISRSSQDPCSDSRLPALAIRTEVYEVLMSLAARSKEDERAELDDLVRNLIEMSSERLNALLARPRT